MKRYIITLTVSFFLIIFGIILTVSEVLDFSISDSFNNKSLSLKTLTYDIKIDKALAEIDTKFTKNPVITYDNTITSGNMKITVTYYDDFILVNQFSLTDDDKNVIYVTADGTNNFKTVKKIFQLTVDGLKKKEVYNYVTALKPEVKIMINEADKDVVKIRK